MADDLNGLNRLLHIYDAESYSIRATAWARRNASIVAPLMVYPVPVEGGRWGLRTALDKLVKEGLTFQRCLVETHGNVGAIFFDDERVDESNLVQLYGNRGYENIFSHVMANKIYFNGCYIADDGGGWQFLDTVGRVFLRRAGGVVMAQTGAGRHLLGWTTLTGHIIHFGADTCYSTILPGGMAAGHTTD
ncbi:MAG TPA: hypothetical protein VGL12_01890 [Roseiarcus sp.]|jgi:hypothetical protein